MGTRTVVVLGGGVGGVAAANELRRLLSPADRVVVVEREARHLFQPSLLWLMVGRRRVERISRPLADLLKPGVEILRADVRSIDPATRRVETSAGDVDADALVIALGAEYAPERIVGFGDAAHDFYTVAGAVSLARAIDGFRGGRVVVAVTGLPFKCPAAPYEAALLIDDELSRRGVRKATEIDVYTPEPQPMPVAGPAMGQAVEALLAAKSIGFHARSPIERFEPASREIVLGDGTRVGYDLVAGVPPHQPPPIVRASGLGNEAGWLPVERDTMRTSAEAVYAVGDVTFIPLANGKPLPKAGVFAHGQALVAAGQIAALLGVTRPARNFDGIGYCWVEAGGGQAGFAVGRFFAEPDPEVDLRRPGRLWHVGKVLFERYWLGGPLEKRVASLGLDVGARLFRIPPGRM